MASIKFLEDSNEYPIISINKTDNIITIKGSNIPDNVNGFDLICSDGDIFEYHDFTTIYNILENGIQFSNDNSVATKDVCFSIVWENEYEGIINRPNIVNIETSIGEEQLSINNNWTIEYKNIPIKETVIVKSSDDIEYYDKEIIDNVITYTYNKEIISEEEKWDKVFNRGDIYINSKNEAWECLISNKGVYPHEGIYWTQITLATIENSKANKF